MQQVGKYVTVVTIVTDLCNSKLRAIVVEVRSFELTLQSRSTVALLIIIPPNSLAEL